MDSTPRRLHFVQCVHGRGKPKPTSNELIAVRSHVMKEHFRKNPRRSKKRSEAVLKSASASVLQHTSVGAKDAANKAIPLTERSTGKVSLPKQAITTQSDQQDDREFLRSTFHSVATPDQFRVQIRDVFFRLFRAPNPVYNLTISLGDTVQHPHILPAAREAGDALCLLQIAVEYLDKRWLIQAMTSYQKALARTRSAITRSAKTVSSYRDIMAVASTLCSYEMFMRTDFPGSGWTEHIKALSSLMRRRLTVKPATPHAVGFGMILHESVFMTLQIGILTRRRVGYKVEDIMDVFEKGELGKFSLSRIIVKIILALDFLDGTNPGQLEFQPPLEDIETSLRLGAQLEAELEVWTRDDPTRAPLKNSITDLPKFSTAIGPELCGQLSTVYVFSSAMPAVVHQTVWQTVFILLDFVRVRLENVNIDLLESNIVFGSDQPQSERRDVIARRLDWLASEICRTLPIMFDRMGGCGQAIAWNAVTLLVEYYQRLPRTNASLRRQQLLNKIQQSLLPGFAIQRLLAETDD